MQVTVLPVASDLSYIAIVLKVNVAISALLNFFLCLIILFTLKILFHSVYVYTYGEDRCRAPASRDKINTL